jgi:hypothetical protein
VRDDVGDAHDRALVHQDSRRALVDREHRQYLSTFKCRVGATARALVAPHERGRVDPASHADPRTTMRYDRARVSLDRHATYVVAAFIAGAAR